MHPTDTPMCSISDFFSTHLQWKIEENSKHADRIKRKRIKKDFQGKWTIHEEALEEVAKSRKARNDYAGYLDMKHELSGTEVQIQARDGKVLIGMNLDQESSLEYVVEYLEEVRQQARINDVGSHYSDVSDILPLPASLSTNATRRNFVKLT